MRHLVPSPRACAQRGIHRFPAGFHGARTFRRGTRTRYEGCTYGRTGKRSWVRLTFQTDALDVDEPRAEPFRFPWQYATIQSMERKTIKPYTRMEHIDVQTPDGPARMLVRRHYDASNISGASYGLDWWRTPTAPQKSRVRRVLDVLLRLNKT